ncbi:lipid-A-disaccharide synthase [Bacilli bacterium]|nr:lipid-A-disaccharide synthase [Bacilli bacterium]
MNMKKKILIMAGEKSGDLLGSKIIDSLDKNLFEISIVGGVAMEKSGLKSLFPMNELSVMGIFEILPKLFNIIKRIEETARFAVETGQDVVLTIDSPDFCSRVAKKIRKLDKNNKIKIAHLIAPSVWFYRENRAKKIAKIYDILFCILPFEPPYFEKYGLRTIFVGHPLFGQEFKEHDFNNENHHYRKDSKTISLTPGSRKTEVKVLLPIIVGVVDNLRKIYDFNYTILATEDTHELIKNYLKNRNIDYINLEKDPVKKEIIIKNSLIAIAKSGTNTLEIAAHSIPMVAIYRFNFLTNILAFLVSKIRTGVKFVNLINILVHREIIPEILLYDCNPDNISKKVSHLIDNEQIRIEQIEGNLKTLKALGYGSDDSPSRIIINEICKLVDV